MKYVICGKSDSFYIYRKNNKSESNKLRHARTRERFDEITEEDTIVLLSGWWARSWAKDALKEIMQLYPQIRFEYLDGPFGENERKTLKSESIRDRFDILDL
jgi:hypothetical protein